jgi:hypothetical protein
LHQVKHKESTGTGSSAKSALEIHQKVVIGQATINLDLQVLKSLKDSLPKPYCADLAEAYVTREVMSMMLMCKERYDMRLPNRCLHQKPLAKSGNGKQTPY